MATDADRLIGLLQSGNAFVLAPTFEEEYALGCVREAALSLSSDLMLWDAMTGLVDGLIAGGTAVPASEHPAAALYHVAREPSIKFACFLDLCDFLGDPKTLRAMRNLIDAMRSRGGCVVLIDHRPSAPEVLRTHAAVLEFTLPDERELREIVRRTARRLHESSPVEVDLSESELGAIIGNLRGLTRRQAERVVADIIVDDRRLSAGDLEGVIQRKREHVQSGGMLEFVSSPRSLGEIGGMGRLKRWLVTRSESLSPRAVEAGLPAPRGVLLLGVQGAGKSLCAKAVATAWKRPLMRMDVGAMYDRFIGESERRLRATLAQAEMMSPVVLWIDEIEKAFAGAANQSTDGGLSRRMFGALLTWMQEHDEPVFLVATANDIGALPPELLRKGRFDEIFFVDLPGGESRGRIFEIHLERQGLDAGAFDLETLVRASDGYSGAEIEQAVIASKHEGFSADAVVTTERLVAALVGSPPLSVTMAEQIAALREWAAGRCVPAGE